MELDQVTVRNLELVEPLFLGQDSRATSSTRSMECQTPMGKRLLRATILRPLVDRRGRWSSLTKAVAEGMEILPQARGDSAGVWRILDLERLAGAPQAWIRRAAGTLAGAGRQFEQASG